MTNPHETLEELEARLQAKIKDYRAGEKRRLIEHGIALWTRTELEQTMAYEATLPPEKVN
jgi:hypothetical protein